MKKILLILTVLIAFTGITTKVKAQQNILNYIKVYFTQPIDSTFSNGVKATYLNDVVFDTLAAYINRAKYTIDICQYEYKTYTGDPIYVAINNAFSRGVKIRYIQDGSEAATNTGVALLNASIPVVESPTTSAYGICHNKFVIIDEYAADSTNAVVWTGSPDWDADMSKGDYNNVIIFQSKVLARAYTHEFNIMWGDTTHGGPYVSATSKFGKYKPNSGNHVFNIGGTEVELYFSPSDSVNREIITTIGTANVDLYCGMFTFTKVTDANDIVNQKNSGAFAAAILDHFSSGGYTPYTTIFPTNLGTNFVGYSSGYYLYHNKYLIVNPSAPCFDPKILTGSHNWTASADTKNDENTVIVHNDTIANLYLQSFAGDFKAISGHSLTKVPNPLDTTTLSQTICQNNNYNFYGTNLNTAGTYFHTIVSYHGCDSIVKLSLAVNPVDTTVQSQAICQGGSYNFYGTYLTTANTYYHTLVSSHTCDSIIKLTLIVNPNPIVSVSASPDTICMGYSSTLTAIGASTYSWYGLYFGSSITVAPNTNTTYTVSGTTSGCTSTASVTVYVSLLPQTPTIAMHRDSLTSNAANGNQWYNTNSLIIGANDSIYIPAITGNYFVIVTDSNGCISDTSNKIYVVITGLNDLSDNKNIEIYPNPTTDNITIDASNIRFKTYLSDRQVLDLRIYDVMGNLIIEKTLVDNKTNIDISALSKGVYFIKINTEDGVAVRKFVKQ